MTTHPAPSVPALDQFQWKPQPKAQAIVNALAQQCIDRCPGAAELSRRMKADTGTRFVDWIDHIHVQSTPDLVLRLQDAGYERKPHPGAPECWVCELGMFPHIVLEKSGPLRVALKVESVADFAATWAVDGEPIDGEPLSPMRRVRAWAGDGAELWVIERHGYRGYETPRPDPARGVLMLRHLEAFRKRRRDFETDDEGFAHVNALVDAAVKDLGVDLACDLFFAAERDYWMRRNRAARVQKSRQDTIGMGWANHDHHTYRCSRRNFHKLVALWEKLGFFCRERFYAGAQAGWGAQVMEQPVTGIITFNDVDMSPEELLGDFAHTPMPEQEKLGTVGLWCALHGEAVLQAGMHHLEAMFDWHGLAEQLETHGVKTMAPFTTFPYLRQAFTEGERWAVSEKRIGELLAKGQITAEQAETFRTKGAIGSHLENLERNDGFKGFNQEGVSDIIARTDPRKLAQLIGV